MTFTAKIAMLAAACFVAFTTQTQAATLIATYTGTVSGTDGDGMFGASNADLAGQNFSVVYSMDTATLTPVQSSGANYVDNYDYGPGTVSITIGNVTKNYATASDYLERYQTTSNGSVASQTLVTRSYFGSGSNVAFNLNNYHPTANPIFTSTDPATALLAASTSGLDVYGHLNGSSNTQLTLNATQYGIAISSVPEPASWAMMLVGFGAVGYSLRRRARTSVSFT